MVVDSSGRLDSFTRAVRHHFAISEVVDDDPGEDIDATKGPSLINTKYAKRYDTFSNKLGKLRKKQKVSDLEIQGLVNKYKGVHIEKLSFCIRPRKAKFQGLNNETSVDEEYEEVISIPMP